jgi:hypothetical protein
MTAMNDGKLTVEAQAVIDAAVKSAVSDVLDDVEEILQQARCGEGDGDLRSVISRCRRLRTLQYPSTGQVLPE